MARQSGPPMSRIFFGEGRGRALRLAIIVTFAVVTASDQTLTQPGPNTAKEADAGRAVYLAHCASCHQTDLAGSNEAPELAGSNFIRAWSARTTAELLTLIRTTMPPADRGNLGSENYLNLVAFLLSANGARAGNQPLTANANLAIGSLASGEMPAALRKTLESATADVPDQSQTSRPLGLLVAGQVKNYVPVPDEMLRNPDPGDWLMIRRNYQADSYSPLNSITTANVKGLRLEWVWAMNDGGANEPTPIVHNGIIYLANTSNTVQALDGADGRSDLGKSHRSQRHASVRRHAQPRHLSGQGVPCYNRCEALRARCAERRDRLANGYRRFEEGIRQHERAPCDPWKGRARAHRVLTIQARGLLH